MNMKGHILAALAEQFEGWDELLGDLSPEQILVPLAPSEWTIKDVIAHLWAWQQRTRARFEAARSGQAPEFPQWVPGLDPDADATAERTNAWLYAANRDLPWEQVYEQWKAQFVRILELSQGISEKDLLDGDTYPWLKGYSLASILVATYGHHQEHFETLVAWLRAHGKL